MFTPSHYFGNPALHETEGFAAMEGHHDHLSRKVDPATGEVLDHQPPQPSADHEWDGTAKRWVPNAAARDHQAALLAAQARIATLAAPERAAMRRLILDPSDADARRALTTIDDELASLSKLLARSGPAESTSSTADVPLAAG